MENKRYYDIAIMERTYNFLTRKHEYKEYCNFRQIEKYNLLTYIDVIKELISKRPDSYKYVIMIV